MVIDDGFVGKSFPHTISFIPPPIKYRDDISIYLYISSQCMMMILFHLPVLNNIYNRYDQNGLEKIARPCKRNNQVSAKDPPNPRA
jgi:glutathione peroxidase-family protein